VIKGFFKDRKKHNSLYKKGEEETPCKIEGGEREPMGKEDQGKSGQQ
jgi:hypothetical protein